MTHGITFKIDGREISAEPGQTILEAARMNGVYIPHLCAHPDLVPWGACRICVVKVNGRLQAACTQPVALGALVDNDTKELNGIRQMLVEMLFVEGNHFCPVCEKSGNCELQALAYRLGVTSPRYPYRFPKRDPDMTHPEVMIDHNRCILCARCVRASRDVDNKYVFDFAGRGIHKHLIVDAKTGVASGTTLAVADKALAVCPVGSLLKKRVGFTVPVGQRLYDIRPIGSVPNKDTAFERRQ
jgi:[NiFe] hydrogenase diaphorase moiety small subunit